MKRFLFLLFLSLAAGVSLWAAGAPDEPAPPPPAPENFEEFVVKAGSVDLTTNATGTLTPRNRTVVPSPLSTKVEWVIDECAAVKKGTEIARLDCTDQMENLEQAELELSAVEAELRRAKYEEQLTKETLEFDVKRCELSLESARLKRSLLGPPTPSDAELSRLTMEQTKFAMDAADREYARLKILGEKGIESTRTVATGRLKFEQAQADHLKAKADYELLMKGTAPEDIAVADQTVKLAEVSLDLAKKRLTSQAAYEATQVRVAEVGVERVKSNIDLCQGRINSSHVVAPVDGVVIFPRNYGMPLRAGDPVWRSSSFLDIADLSDMTVEAVVSQTDWPRVEPGQKVDIRLVAFPDKLFRGTVEKVGKLARDRSLILSEEVANVMSFNVIVDVDEKSPDLRASYTAKISITTDHFEKCIAVPRSAPARCGAQDIVWVKTPDGPAPRPVTLGAADATQVVVEKGLQAGETVLVPVRLGSEAP